LRGVPADMLREADAVSPVPEPALSPGVEAEPTADIAAPVRGPEESGPGAVLLTSSPVIISGQDMCLDLLVNRIAAEGHSALRSFMGCYNGLYALYHGRVTMSAAHLWDGETDTYNYPFIRRLLPGLPVGVLRLAGRMQGFYVKKGNPLGIRDWRDLARPGLTMINRERGSGTRILLDQKLKLLDIDTAKIRGYRRESPSHMGCASTVARGGADVSCGCEGAAEQIPAIDFVPLQLEWYDFVFRLADRRNSVVKGIFTYISSVEFRRDMETMGGYDLSQTGRYEEF
ncbi:MAG: substrate-binding domain-containing protein, partial [Treponema sp.]|nr:substrate-binding domain-containing protein [Treponema sp.]